MCGLRLVLIAMVRLYQRILSPLSIGACRFYPSCSEYALWLLRFDTFPSAFYKIIFRILSCNQFFQGGIGYPVVSLEIRNLVFAPKWVKYWFVPTEKVSFLDIIPVAKKTYIIQVYIIKSFPKR